MHINPSEIARIVTSETGIGFSERHGINDGEHWINLNPIGHSKSNTFTLRTIIGWRHIEVLFIPGSFSGDLLNMMCNSSENSRNLFVRILKHSQKEGASISLNIGNKSFDFEDSEIWKTYWVNVTIRFRIGQLNLSDDAEINTQSIVRDWISRMAAAVISLMPIERNHREIHDSEHYPEGSSISVQVNRYERDPRNRAAALSIHGFVCKVCNLLMSDIYGDVASGFIEVHHTKPISELGNDYLIDPEKDLLPLCPNCHSIVHRKNPPYTLNELKKIMEKECG